MKKYYAIMSELRTWPMLWKDLLFFKKNNSDALYFFKKKTKHYSNLGHVVRMHNRNFPYCQGNEGTAIKSLWNTNAEARFAK